MPRFITSRLTRLLLVVSAGILTVLHQMLAVNSWPHRSSLGELVMLIPPYVVVVIVIALLGFVQCAFKNTGTTTARLTDVVVSALALGSIFFGALYMSSTRAIVLAQHVSKLLGSPTVLTILIAAGVALWTAWKARKLPASEKAGASWGTIEIALCCMFALNMFFIALPEIRFFFGFVGQHQPISQIAWPNFNLFYSDTQKIEANPIFDAVRFLLVWYTPEYFLTPLACAYFMALAIAFFCAAASPFLGYYGSFAVAAGLCWSKAVLLSVFMVTNLVTLFFSIGFSAWLVYQAHRVTALKATPFRIISTGILIGLALAVTLYAYVASRSICAVILGVATLVLASGITRRSDQRVYYMLSVLAIGIVPVTILLQAYYGKWHSLFTDLRAGVPPLANVLSSRPIYIDPNIEASTPDLPAYYGALIADAPQPDGTVKRDWVYWYRSPSELAWVLWSNFGRILKHHLPFPGGAAAWLFALIGLAGSLALIQPRRKAIRYGAIVCLMTLILISPFLIILSPGDWRRGVAVVLIFGSLVGFGVHLVIRIFFPKVNEMIVALLASVLIFVVLGRAAIDSIAATATNDVGIAMVCRFNPVGPLYRGLKRYPNITGRILLVGSSEDRCAYSASRQLDTMLGGERVQLVAPTASTITELQTQITARDGIAIHCGPLTGGTTRKLCDQLRGSTEAIEVYSAPADRDEIWMLTKG